MFGDDHVVVHFARLDNGTGGVLAGHIDADKQSHI
jgi:hypothetical protein